LPCRQRRSVRSQVTVARHASNVALSASTGGKNLDLETVVYVLDVVRYNGTTTVVGSGEHHHGGRG
jgi:hypothetical protein